jgi:putative ABC transport system permease protein
MPDPSTFRHAQGRPDPSTSSASSRPFDKLSVVPSGVEGRAESSDERVEGRAESRGDWAPHVRPRLSSLHLSPAREAEIVDELSQHLDDRWRELMAGGVSPDQATLVTLAEFKEAKLLEKYLAPLRQSQSPPSIVPGAPTGHVLGNLWRDLRYAARMLRRQPGFSGAAVVTLALAIGATTAIFTVVDALLLRSLPFPEADRLVQLGRGFPGGFGSSTSIPKFIHWRNHGQSVFAETAAYNDLGTGFNLAGSSSPERLTGSHVSAGFFDVMGVHPSLGRAFTPAADVPGGPKLVVLSRALWRNRFGANPNIIGEAITLNTQPYTVIGVMPDGFRYPDVADLWTLFQFDPASRDRANNLEVAARLKPGTTLDQARGAMGIAASALRRAEPELMGDNETVGIRPLRERLYGDMRSALLILLASVGLVLLIGCVNVANLQLAQAAGRHHEIALRTALGASAWDVARQLLVESVLLAAIGGVAGVALAYVAVPALLALSPVQVPYAERIAVDGRVLVFTLTLSLVAGLVVGLLPAWQSARPNLDDVLRAGSHRMIGGRSHRTRRALVAGQVALALMLTIGAFLLVKSLAGLQSTNPGFAVENVLTMKLALPEAKYGNAKALALFHEQVEERLTALPGVRAAAVAHTLPLELGSDLPFTIEDRYVPGTETGVGEAEYRPIGQGYFDTLEIPLRRGRLFDRRDRWGTLPVAIINEVAARRIWPGENPIGQRITVGQPFVPDLADPSPREIIGIVGDVREEGLGADPPPIVYVPLSQQNEAYAALGVRLLPFSVVVRGEATVAALTRSVQQAIWSVDPQQAISDVRLMREIVARSLGPQSFNTVLLGGLAALALLLAAVGLYGVIAHIVTQQSREIGVRMALGATRSNVLGLFLRQALFLAAVGIVVGLAGAFSLTRVLRTLLTGISTSDPWVFALAPALLFAVAVVAALRPALRAAGVDPASALRAE